MAESTVAMVGIGSFFCRILSSARKYGADFPLGFALLGFVYEVVVGIAISFLKWAPEGPEGSRNDCLNFCTLPFSRFQPNDFLTDGRKSETQKKNVSF